MPYGPKPIEDTNFDNLVLCTKPVDTACRPAYLASDFSGSTLTTFTPRVSKTGQIKLKLKERGISMKRALGYVVVVMLAAMASVQVFAQANPLFGTWKLNPAKSKYTGMPAPKEMTRIVEADGDSVKYTTSGTAADGSAISFIFSVKFDGKDYPITGNALYARDMRDT